jgi:hypothetical protein
MNAARCFERHECAAVDLQTRSEEARKQFTKEMDEMRTELYATKIERDDAIKEAQDWIQHVEDLNMKYLAAQVWSCTHAYFFSLIEVFFSHSFFASVATLIFWPVGLQCIVQEAHRTWMPT